MLAKETVCDFGDILSFAETIGYGWNEAHNILVDANVYQGSVELGKVDEGSRADDILSKFFKHHNVSSVYIKAKNAD